jgi:formate-dependent nitrite reductase membrane component NrfD
VLYFFVGGIAGGSFFLAALLDLFGMRQDRPTVRAGYYVALVGAVLSGILLTWDLNRPERFWHMLIQSERGVPMFKYWSPMSIGSWALLLFGGVALLASLGALYESGRVRWALLRVLQRRLLRILIIVSGGLLGFFIAGYTGVLLSVTNRPLWADTPWLGVLFLISGASTAAALLILLGLRRSQRAPDTVRWLSRMDSGTLLLELVILFNLAMSLGPVLRLWISAWGVLLLVGVVLVGMLLPLLLHWRPGLLGSLSRPAAAVCVLLGGFILRVVVVLSSEGASALRWGSLTVILAIGMTACTSPEASRTRGGGRGADVGNRDAVVEIHAGARPYYQTPCWIIPGCPAGQTQ